MRMMAISPSHTRTAIRYGPEEHHKDDGHRPLLHPSGTDLRNTMRMARSSVGMTGTRIRNTLEGRCLQQAYK